MNHRKQNKLKAVIIATINASFDLPQRENISLNPIQKNFSDSRKFLIFFPDNIQPGFLLRGQWPKAKFTVSHNVNGSVKPDCILYFQKR